MMEKQRQPDKKSACVCVMRVYDALKLNGLILKSTELNEQEDDRTNNEVDMMK
jgi:hypothetical protein